MKTLTAQLSALKVKSEHDDELVEVLIVSNYNCIYFLQKPLKRLKVFWENSAWV